MQRLSGTDSLFLAGETPAWHQHVAGLSIIDPSGVPDFSFDAVVRSIGERLPLIPKLTWKLREVPLGLHRAVWIADPDFDVRRHVRRIGVPAPGGPRETADSGRADPQHAARPAASALGDLVPRRPGERPGRLLDEVPPLSARRRRRERHGGAAASTSSRRRRRGRFRRLPGAGARAERRVPAPAEPRAERRPHRGASRGTALASRGAASTPSATPLSPRPEARCERDGAGAAHVVQPLDRRRGARWRSRASRSTT